MDTASPLHTDGRLASFTSLPFELIYEILFLQVYDGDEFSNDIDYADRSQRMSRLSMRLAGFTATVLLVNRVFYRVGVRVRWRFLVIRSPQVLVDVVRLAKTSGICRDTQSLGGYTCRLDLQLSTLYDSKLLSTLLEALPNLKILLLRNFAPLFSHWSPPHPSLFVQAVVAHCPNLTRLQLDSKVEIFCHTHLVQILRAIPSLKTLRVAWVEDPVNTIDAEEPKGPRVEIALETLSLGSLDHVYRPDARQFRKFLEGLSESTRPAKLRRLHFFESESVLDTALTSFGFQLQFLLLCAPPRHQHPPTTFRWVELCPNLEELTWLVRGWFTVDPPRGHDALRRIKLLYLKEAAEAGSDCEEHLLSALGIFREGGYDLLEEVVVAMRGENLPNVDFEAWARQEGEHRQAWKILIDNSSTEYPA